MIELFRDIGRRHKMVVFTVILLLAGFLGLTDYLIGVELSFSIFYLIPVSMVTLTLGKHWGFIVSLVSAAVWLAADLAAGSSYSHVLIPYWNATVRLGYFSLHTLLLSELIRLLDDQKQKSLIDPLTGAANWRYFEEFTNKELARLRRNKKSMTLAYIDLDNFKHINDQLGHDVGDELLKTIADIIQGHLRPSDMLSRLGGDEFAILLSEAQFSDASVVLQRLNESVLSEMKSRGWPVTLSIGAVTYSILPASITPVLKKADETMYMVKNSGKNRIEHIEWPARQV